MGIRCADHVTPLYPQKLALTSPTGGGRSVGIVRSRIKATELFMLWTSELIFILLSLLATCKRRGSYCCDWEGNIFKVLNISLHKSQILHPLLILIIFFLYFTNFYTTRVPQNIFPTVHNRMKLRILTFRHRASCIWGQAFHYSPENAFYVFNQQIYFIIWYFLDRASLI